jgi:hypothetical protein
VGIQGAAGGWRLVDEDAPNVAQQVERRVEGRRIERRGDRKHDPVRPAGGGGRTGNQDVRWERGQGRGGAERRRGRQNQGGEERRGGPSRKPSRAPSGPIGGRAARGDVVVGGRARSGGRRRRDRDASGSHRNTRRDRQSAAKTPETCAQVGVFGTPPHENLPRFEGWSEKKRMYAESRVDIPACGPLTSAATLHAPRYAVPATSAPQETDG